MTSTTEETIVTTVLNGTSSPAIEKLLFSWFDHSLFALMLGVSALIGIYFGFCSKKQDNVAEYILGGKEMRTFPIAMSLVASHISGITVLAVPADIYTYGASYWLSSVAVVIVGATTVMVYLPVFYKLQLTSSYEYLSLRFDNSVRTLASFLFVFSMVIYMPIVIYIPALAFAQVTNVNIHMITPIVCIVCIFYTTLGGLKAVVWTDTLQFSIMIIAMVVVLFLGFNATGSIKDVFEKSYEGGRLMLWDMNPDPTVRTSFWSVVIGLASSWTSYIAVSQSCIQKFLSLPTMNCARRAILIFVFGICIVKSISSITGLIIYTKYSDCDPLATGDVKRADQLLPYFIMDVAGKIPGLPGLFIAGVFCAALSTMSAGLNTLSGVIYEDFIKPFMPKNTTEKRASDIMKFIVIATGVIATSMVFIVEHLGSILPLSISFGGVANGPLLGMFSLGMLVPFSNTKGTLTGAISGLLFVGTIVFGAQYHNAHGGVMTPKLPTSVEGCTFAISEAVFNATTMLPSNAYTPPWLFRVSFYYYGLIGCTTTILIGIIASFLTGGRDQKVDRDLLSPCIYFMLPREQKMDYKTVEHAMEIMAKNYSHDKDEDDIKR